MSAVLTVESYGQGGAEDAEAAVVGAVAAVLALPVGIVAYICSVCGARSFWSCMSAVKRYFSRGGC